MAATISGKRGAKIMSVTSDETHTIRIPLSDDAEAIVFNFVDPAWPSWRLFGQAGQASLKLNEPTDPAP
jgi:hypothetical protein